MHDSSTGREGVSDIETTCPGLHNTSNLPPEAPAVTDTTARCPDCWTVSRICDGKDCRGRSRAGSFFCRICGHRLKNHWLQRFWEDFDPNWTLAEPQVRRQLKGTEFTRAQQTQLLTSDAWLALRIDRALFLLEPGPELLLVSELELSDGELLVALRAVETEDPHLNWQLLTSSRSLTFVPGTAAWSEVETFPHELLWESRGLRAYLVPPAGTVLYMERQTQGPPLLEVNALLPAPTWLPDGRVVLQGPEALYVGSGQSGLTKYETAAPQGLAPSSPIYDPLTQRLLVSGHEALYTCEIGNKPVAFLPSGTATLFPAPDGIAVLESDRLRIVQRSTGASLWDSRSEIPTFARSTLAWDHVATVLLLPMANLGEGVQLQLIDLRNLGNRRSLELPAGLLCEPRLAPGGIAAVRLNAEQDAVELIWIEAQGKGGES